MPGRRHRALILGALLAVAASLASWVLLHRAPSKAAAPHVVPVSVAAAVSKDVPLTFTELGSAQAWISDTILAQVTGKLMRVNFTEGADVRAGQVLAEVDPRPYQAALAQAEGALARDIATLQDARRNLARYQHLLADSAIARQTVDDQAATVAQLEGVVRIDQGQVAAARINLGFCRIVSPITGRAGVRLVDPGNLVSAAGSVGNTPVTAAATNTSAASGSGGGSGIVVINQIQPIAVTFTAAQGQFQRLQTVSNGFSQTLAVQAMSQETGELLDNGVLIAADNHVDAATGTVELKARFPNTSHRLWPGQLVNVRLVLQTLRNATVIPSTAVNRGPKGPFAFVVGPDGHATVRPLVIAATEGRLAVVANGVSPGEQVVTDGQMTLRAASAVRIAQRVAVGGAGS